MNIQQLYTKALNFEFLTLQEGVFLYQNSVLPELMWVANEMRKKIQEKTGHKNVVGWIIDRNVNYANACVSHCKFCNFYRTPASSECYITSMEEYRKKIEEMLLLGGNQLLLQGGLHPKLKIDFYENLFSQLKKEYPNVKLHALGPPEIHHIARISKLSYTQTLQQLIAAGLDSLPGAGAEILSDRVRKILSPGKCLTEQWLSVMREAHKMKITTSATMMYGHIETLEERINHLILLRELQAEKPENSNGFTTFVAWPFQDDKTELKDNLKVTNKTSAEDYIRVIATSRIMMPNILNIQASWLTVGKDIAQLCLHSGANDFGSIMIEENVVSAAGANHKFNATEIQQAIKEAGFTPRLRNQKYEYSEETIF